MECRVRDIPIYYEEMGAGRPMLMLHGSHTDHREMVYNMETLFEQRSGWRRIYPDLPGRGKTPGADWITGEDQMLEVTLDFLDAVAPGERFAVAGYSYGGYMARGIVYRRGTQMDGVMLGAPSVERDRAKSDLPPHQILVHDPDFVAALEENEQMILRVAVVQSMERLASFRAAIMSGFAVADHAFLKRVGANLAFSFEVDKPEEPFPGPALIVTGRQDSMCGYREAWTLLDNYPRATFAVLDRAGHGVSGEQKVLYRALISEWLDRVEEYSAGH
ncbi:MAG: alpha/beta hydrolase [Chloroflexia bacterium]